jgi:hypothetical protein
MTDKSKKSSKTSKPIPFMVYFKTKAEKDRMRRAAAIRQHSPRPNQTEYARLAIAAQVAVDLGENL